VGQNHTKIYAGLSVSKVKKLLYDSRDLTPRLRGRKKQHERNEWQVLQIKAVNGERVNANVYQELLRQHVVL
jgi:hypothetical protein